MVTERAIINALIIGATLIVAPFIISSTLTVDYVPLAIFGLIVAFLLAFFVLRDRLALLPILGSSISLSLNFLPLPLDAGHVICVMLILYYITGYVIIRQRRIRLGKPSFLWPIVIIVLILLYHNHTPGAIRAVGGESATEGAKPAFLVYIIFAAYICGINVKTPSVEFVSKLPLYTVYCAVFSTALFMLTTVVPAAAPIVHLITNNVNVAAYMEARSQAVGGDGPGVGRLGILATLAMPLQAYLLCRYPIGTWIRPDRWWIIGASLFCAGLVVGTGFRNILFSYMMIIMASSWCYYSWRSLLIPATFGLGMFLLVVGSSNKAIALPLNKLPVIVQRSMSFLPGDWAPEVLQSAEASNDFRQRIKDVYIQEYMYNSPWIGNGYNVNTKLFEDLNNSLLRGYWGKDQGYIQAKAFIEGKQYHTGWISLYDIVGIIGFISFLILAFNELSVLAGFIFGAKADRRSSLFPLYVWMFSNLAAMIAGFFVVFGDFSQSFSDMMIVALVLSHLLDLRKVKEAPPIAVERKSQSDFGRPSEARYGYNTRY